MQMMRSMEYHGYAPQTASSHSLLTTISPPSYNSTPQPKPCELDPAHVSTLYTKIITWSSLRYSNLAQLNLFNSHVSIVYGNSINILYSTSLLLIRFPRTPPYSRDIELLVILYKPLHQPPQVSRSLLCQNSRR
jgi:hypothetical protein